MHCIARDDVQRDKDVVLLWTRCGPASRLNSRIMSKSGAPDADLCLPPLAQALRPGNALRGLSDVVKYQPVQRHWLQHFFAHHSLARERLQSKTRAHFTGSDIDNFLTPAATSTNFITPATTRDQSSQSTTHFRDGPQDIQHRPHGVGAYVDVRRIDSILPVSRAANADNRQGLWFHICNS
jgi:hypothetical protein